MVSAARAERTKRAKYCNETQIAFSSRNSRNSSRSAVVTRCSASCAATSHASLQPIAVSHARTDSSREMNPRASVSSAAPSVPPVRQNIFSSHSSSFRT